MLQDLALALRLQALDRRIANLENEVATLPKHIAEIEKKLDAHTRRLEADRAALVANQRDRKKLEGDIQVHEQKISKLRDQTLLAKTNEQYKAFQNEIAYVQAEIRKAEDTILDLMEQSEPLDKNVKTADVELGKQKLHVEAEKKHARERTAVDQKALAEAFAERERHCGPNGPQADGALRTDSKEDQRHGHRGCYRRTLRRLYDCAATSIPAGFAARRGDHVLRMLRPHSHLQSRRRSLGTRGRLIAIRLTDCPRSSCAIYAKVSIVF